MQKRSLFTIKRKAKRFKRWLEKVSVYPDPFEISGCHYYLVDYIKLRRPVASAVISETNEVEQEAKKAHRSLYQFYRLSEKVHNEGRMRAHVDLNFFRVPLAKMDEQPNPKWEEGYALIKELLAYQLTYVKTYDDFRTHMRKRKDERLPLTEGELELAIYTAAKLETIQYHVVYLLSQNVDVLKQWKKAMDQEDLWKSLKKDQQAFYTQLMQNEEAMKEEAKKVKSNDFDQALKMNRKEMANFMKKEQKADEEILRYPSAD